MSLQTLKIGSLNMCGCNMLECKWVIGKMFVEQKFDVSAMSETKLKVKSDCEFVCVSGRL